MAEIEQDFDKIQEYLSSFIVPKSKKSIEEVPQISEISIKNSNFCTSLALDTVSKNPERQLSSRQKTTQPLNEKDFKERLSTFKITLWSSVGLSPLLCASYGWKLLEKDLLQCVTCKRLLCASLPPPTHCEAYKKFSALLKERLQTSHAEWCGWTYNQSSPKFLHPPLNMTVHDLESIRDESHNLCPLKDSLPYLDTDELLQKLNLEKNQISLFGSSKSPTKIQLTSALLVLTGWILGSNQQLRCKICLRNICLWNFLSLKEEDHFNSAKEKYLKNQELRKQKEIKRKDKEHKLKIKEEFEKVQKELKRKAEEEERKAAEQAKRVQEALAKVSRLKDVDSLSDCEESDEDDEGLGEEEENSLLAEDGDQDKEEEKLNNIICESDGKSEKMECDQSGGEPLDESEGGDKKDKRTSESSPKEEHGTELNPMKSSLSFSAENSLPVGSDDDPLEKEAKDSENESVNSATDELWMEAVGTCAQGTSPSCSSTDEEEEFEDKEVVQPDCPLPSSNSQPGQKRRRSSEQSTDDPVVDGSPKEREPHPAKMPRLDELEQEERPQSSIAEGPQSEAMLDHPTESDSNSDSESLLNEEELIKEEKLFTKMEGKLFKPLDQHHHWCGWVIACSSLYLDDEVTDQDPSPFSSEEKQTEQVLGYQILPEQLKQTLTPLMNSTLATSEKYVRNVEGLRAVRGILDSWTVDPEIE